MLCIFSYIYMIVPIALIWQTHWFIFFPVAHRMIGNKCNNMSCHVNSFIQISHHSLAIGLEWWLMVVCVCVSVSVFGHQNWTNLVCLLYIKTLEHWTFVTHLTVFCSLQLSRYIHITILVRFGPYLWCEIFPFVGAYTHTNVYVCVCVWLFFSLLHDIFWIGFIY